jgi:P4 family phage/plasmid primase-like protien
MANGTLHIAGALDALDGGELILDPAIWQPKSAKLFSLNGLPYPCDPAARCERWQKYLDVVQPDPADRDLLRMLCGLMLVPETRFNCFFLLVGRAGTGKSVFLHVLEALVGAHNVCCVPLNKFADDHYTWQLTENLLNSIDDMGAAGVKDRDIEGAIKVATDGRPLDIRRLYADGTRAPVIARTVAACNTLPRFQERSEAIWDRLRVIPFVTRVRDTATQDSRLRETLVRDELPGIFLWALSGLRMLRTLQVFPEHTGGLEAKAQHHDDCDPEGSWLRENYQRSETGRMESRSLYAAYRVFATENGYGILSASKLNTAVTRVFGVHKSQYRAAGQVVTGFLGLAHAAPPSLPPDPAAPPDWLPPDPAPVTAPGHSCPAPSVPSAPPAPSSPVTAAGHSCPASTSPPPVCPASTPPPTPER